MNRVLRRAMLLVAVPALGPDIVYAQAAPTSGPEWVDRGDAGTVAFSPRRRRRRPKRRGGPYEVIDVPHPGSIEGVVIHRGTAPEAETIQIVKDHETCDRREKTRPRIRVDAQGRVAEAIVFLGDIKAGKPIPVADAKPVLSQHHCTFEPHVQVLMAGQPFDLVNDDPVAHNAQGVQNMMTLFNPLQPKRGLRNEFTIRRPGLTSITCAVHNWMKAYAYVLWHPYYDVTGGDGRFEITGVPPGRYELVVWQEHLGERTQAVVVEPDRATILEFELSEK